MATPLTEGNVIGDVVKFEEDNRYSRETHAVSSGFAPDLGEVCYNVGADAAAELPAGVADVQTITMSAGTDGGTMVLEYKGQLTAALAFNVATADLQVALRALHSDIDGIVVTTVGGVGVDYVLTNPAADGAIADVHIAVDLLTDGGVLEPATIEHTTTGAIAGAGADGIYLGGAVAAVSDVQTMTLQAGADGGTFKLEYRGVRTANLAYNVSTANMQTAVRALHADLAATVVTTVGGVGVDYVLTTAAKKCANILIVDDVITDGGVLEPASIVHTTQGTAAGDGVFLMRNAIVDTDNMSYGSNVTTTAQELAVLALLAANGIVATDNVHD